MKKQNIVLTVVGLLALVGGGILVYRLFTKPVDKKLPAPEPSASEPETPLGAVTSTVTQAYQQTGNALGDIAGSLNVFFTQFNPYLVNTVSSSLYLRETPDAKGKIIGKFAKGTIIQAKPSKVKGWFEVTDDGKTVKGYVSSVYLKVQPQKKS